MKKFLVVGLTVLTMACLTACGEDVEEDVSTEAAVEAEADVDVEADVAVEENSDEPMTEEQLQTFLSMFKDFMGFTESFKDLYNQDGVAQNDDYDAFVNETYALVDEITNTGIEGLTFAEASQYADLMNQYFELGDQYTEAIGAELGL